MANVTAVTFTWLGGQFQMGDAATPENFTTVNQVDSVDFSGSKRAIENVTSADNTDGADRKAGRTKDWGTCKVMYWHNPNDATHQQLAALDDGAEHDFKVINAVGFGSKTFKAIVQTFYDHKMEINKGVKKTVTLDISGPVTSSIAGA